MPGSKGTAGILSIPPSGFVRVVSRQIEDKPALPPADQKIPPKTETIHYKWSLIGERNWQNPKADTTGFTLPDVLPLNSTTKRGWCNIWECDLTARTVANAAQSKPTTVVAWNLVIHGSNGQTAKAEGIVSQQSLGNLGNSVQVVQTRDEPVRLPADVILAKVGEQEVRLRVAE